MRRLCGLAMAAVVGLMTGRVHGDDSVKMAGDWESTLVVTPQVKLRITLKVNEAKDGELSGTWGSPDESLEGLPLATIAIKDDVVTFATRHGVTFSGKRDAAGTSFAGDWIQRGRKYPMTFRRYDPSKVAAAPPIPKELEGFWEGRIKVGGVIEMRLVLRVEKQKDGRLKAMLASPDQGANQIAISSISLEDGTLHFESKLIGAKYSGKKTKDGTAFEGEFLQSGMKFPLTLKKTDKFSLTLRQQTPKPPFPYRTEEVRYENKPGGVAVAGTLSIPAGKGPFPAVLMITGSGAQDRDETILGHKPFFVIADVLTRRGVAVLRVDDRGVGGSSGSLAEATLDDLTGDVLAGVSYLKSRSEIDPKRIGLIGHSEGGVIAPLAASRSVDVAYIVLMAGTGLPGTDILKAQGRLIWKAEGLSDDELKYSLELQRRTLEILIAEKDEKAAQAKLIAGTRELLATFPESFRNKMDEAGDLSEEAVHSYNNAWFRSFLTYDPRTTLKKVRCPVLAVNGEKDLQVPAKENLAAIAVALEAGGNTDVRTIEFKGLNHLFQPCTTGSPSEYARIETTIAPEVLTTIGDWIVARTPASGAR